MSADQLTSLAKFGTPLGALESVGDITPSSSASSGLNASNAAGGVNIGGITQSSNMVIIVLGIAAAAVAGIYFWRK